MSVRILGGVAKGREMRVPESARPSGARVRKSLFDLLAARAPAARFPAFLDMHGGSGAIGLEAASRGHDVTLVETDLRALKALEANARALELRVRIVKGDSGSLLPRLGSFDVVFSDPPYEADIPALARQVLGSAALKPGGLLVCQHPDRLHLPEHAGFVREERRYGSNSLTLYFRDVTTDVSQDGARDTIKDT
ncbi:methyltransferase domain-containing protein [Deinococcus sp. KSM4-11]|uniref:RsmD family RNA methyltransferase n=1 Tax=Deinococcus sp. KSM4-11 TaxID=2568654 RepID=UPI0010A44D9B|nr:RsmD family RNA methyltransferase [Deinococcus sp. KSM4-11]THF86635.1 methyltransferase domain-containing protein [Deinococcus sp. KSM4-11]